MMQVLEENIDDSEFGIDQMVTNLGTSRPVLYRKIKALTNMTLMEFVMQFRLKKAAQILAQNKTNISEVAYMVGFNDPKYFSKCFHKFYNLTPKEYMQKHSTKGK